MYDTLISFLKQYTNPYIFSFFTQDGKTPLDVSQNIEIVRYVTDQGM